MDIQIPDTKLKRVVVVGGGFGGINLINSLDDKFFQTVLIDCNNYHQFQPLLYQVASSGLDMSSVSFSFRKIFHGRKNFFFRLAELEAVRPEEHSIRTSIGDLRYDYLVIATGTRTNFFGNGKIEESALPMKSVEDSLRLRNTLLLNLEKSLNCTNPEDRRRLLNLVIVGGGATGVEVAGALSEMREYVVPKDYPDLKRSDIHIYLVEAGPRLLAGMAEASSGNAKKSLEAMGVKVLLNKMVKDFEAGSVLFSDGSSIPSETLIWVSGVNSGRLEGLSPELADRRGRLVVDEYNRLKGVESIFVIGDIALQTEGVYPAGYPQVAPVAIQQGRLLAANLKRLEEKKALRTFHYNNQGTLATIGRNRAVADLYGISLHGWPAWAVWMLVHLRSILGVKNKLIVLIDWMWNYFSYDQSYAFYLNIFDTRSEKRSK